MRISEMIERLQEAKAAMGDVLVFVGDMKDVKPEGIERGNTSDEDDVSRYGRNFLHIGEW